MIRTAYQLSDYQISGGPDWIRFDRFDVEAKSEGNPSQNEIRLIVQDLLQDRFKLIHRATEQDTVYALVVAKGGHKMKTMPDDGSGRHVVGASRGHLFTKNGEVAGLVTFLTQIVDRQVIDKTGLKGYFEFDFAFAGDDHALARLYRFDF